MFSIVLSCLHYCAQEGCSDPIGLGGAQCRLSVSVWVGGDCALSGTHAASPDLAFSFCFEIVSYQGALAFSKPTI